MRTYYHFCNTYWALLLLVFLSGCRSEKVNFQFQPTAGQAERTSSSVVKAAAPSRNSTDPAARRTSAQTIAHPATAHQKYSRTVGSNMPAASTHRLAGHRLVRQFVRVAPTASHSRPQVPANASYGGLWFLGGIALCVAAVIIGINLGGFLGLVVGTVLFFVGSLASALGFAGPDKPDPSKPKSETGLRPYLVMLFGLLATVLLVGGGLGLLIQGGTSYLAATLTGAGMLLAALLYTRLKRRSASKAH